jgi:hypothetical protein
MQSALTSVQIGTGLASDIGLGEELAVARKARAFARRHALASTPPANCVNGASDTTTQTSATSETITDDTYYDSACTEIESQMITTLNITSPSPVVATATLQLTEFTIAGSVTSVSTATLAINDTATQQVVTIQDSEANTANTSPFATVGVTCTSPVGSTSISCGAASTATVASVSGAVAVSLSGTVTTAALALMLNLSTYTGTSLSIVPPVTGTAWSIAGGTVTDTITASLNASLSGMATTSLSLTASDSSDGATISLNEQTSSIVGTLTQNGKTVATLTINADGNGTITYPDGTTGTITDFTIVS